MNTRSKILTVTLSACLCIGLFGVPGKGLSQIATSTTAKTATGTESALPLVKPMVRIQDQIQIPDKNSFTAPQVGIKISPALIQEKIEPGKTFQAVLRVTNLSLVEQTFYIKKSNISGMSLEGQPVFTAEGKSLDIYGITSWLKIPEEPIVLPAGATAEVLFLVEVPMDAGPGGHFGAIFVTTQPEKPTATGAAVGYEVASLINLQIAGDVFDETNIREFSADKSVYNKADIKFDIRVENLGNTLVRPTGFIEITNMLGKKTATINVNEAQGGIFPKAIRKFQSDWKSEGFTFGRYQATLSLVYGDTGKKTITSSLSFWVLPMKPIAIFFGTLISFILLVMFLVKFYVRTKLKSAAKAKGVILPTEPLQNFKSNTISRLIAIAVLLLGVAALMLFLLFVFFS